MTKYEDLRLLGTIVTLMVIWPIAARVEQCGSTLRGDGVLQSHGFPRTYPNNYDCDWTFDAGQDEVVTLTFSHFDVEDSRGCRFDYLQILATGHSEKYCGAGVRRVEGGTFTAQGPVRLIFKSDDSETGQGFRLTYSITPVEPEDDVLSCATEPCENGAECVDVDVGEVACFCLDGFEGDFCEIDIDECASNPCQNGGTCIDGVDSFTCECPEGFMGETCSVDVDDCIGEPCINGGTCIDGPNSFECECVTGYTGWNCGQDIDECASAPCLNMGVCEDRIGFYECICYPGYTGVNCEIPPPAEAPEPEVAPASPEPSESAADEQPRPDTPPVQSQPVEQPDQPLPAIPPDQTEPAGPPDQAGEVPSGETHESDVIPPSEPPQHDPAPHGVRDSGVQPNPLTRDPVKTGDAEVNDPAVDDVPEANEPALVPSTTAATNYPNATVGGGGYDSSKNNDTDAGPQNNGDKETQNDSSNIGVIIGIAVGLLGALAIISFVTQYWVMKNKTKVVPADTDGPKNETVSKKDDVINGAEDSNKLDLVEEDFSGRMKLKMGGLDYARVASQVGKALPNSQKSRKKPKKKLSLGKKIKSLTGSKAKNPTATAADDTKSIAPASPMFAIKPQTNAIPEHIQVLNQLNANLDRMLRTSRTPYELPVRNKRAVAARQLMSTMAKQHYRRPSQPTTFPMASLGSPFLGQTNMFTYPTNTLYQSISPTTFPSQPNPNIFNVSIPGLTPAPETSHISAPAQSVFPEPTSPFQNSPTTPPFTNNALVPPITQTSMTGINHGPLNPELPQLERKAKKKSKKHKRSKKKAHVLDESYNVTVSESVSALHDAGQNPSGSTMHNIETYDPPLSPASAGNMPTPHNINGLSALPVSTPMVRRDSATGAAMEMRRASLLQQTNLLNNNVPAASGISEMESIAENIFFSRTPHANASVYSSDNPSNRIGNLPTNRPTTFPVLGSLGINTSLGGMGNEFLNSLDQADHHGRSMSPPQHTILSSQNSNVTDQGNLPPVSNPTNSSSIPGYSFWR